MKDPLIVALDVDSIKKAERIIRRLGSSVRYYKVGSRFFTACGPDAIKLLRNFKKEVFLDLKFYDIPSTVAAATAAACRHRVWMLTLHLSGSSSMLTEAVNAAKEASLRLKIRRPLLIGVSVLTSQTSKYTRREVLSLAGKGLHAGIDGIVCSGGEAPYIRRRYGKKMVVVCPGIRVQGISRDDQRRIITPSSALKNGCDYIVVGRPVILAKDPAKVVEEIRSQLKGVSS